MVLLVRDDTGVAKVRMQMPPSLVREGYTQPIHAPAGAAGVALVTFDEPFVCKREDRLIGRLKRRLIDDITAQAIELFNEAQET